jgi:hypothetical protein
MISEIAYFEEPKELLNALDLGDRVDKLLESRKYFDYSGGIFLPRTLFNEQLKNHTKHQTDLV